MKIMNVHKLKAAMISGMNNLSNNKSRIDSMNVFPIPDGDTGSNMSATGQNAVLEINKKKFDSVDELMKKFSRGMLLGARGNSGVILSQIFKGFSVGLQDKKTIQQFDLVLAFNKATKYAYKSVIKPVEGTILTIIRIVSEQLSKTITINNDCKDVFDLAFTSAKQACIETPNFLPVLKDVGVTDSGGEGLLMIIEGISSHIHGKPISILNEKKEIEEKSFIYDNENYVGKLGYCIELIVELKNKNSFKKEKVKVSLGKMGNSIVLVHDDEILKIHIHSKTSGAILDYSQKYGQFLKVKIENMTLQANQSHTAKNKTSNLENQIAIISCNRGSGIIQEMETLGANYIIETGQTTIPNPKDFIEAINQIKSKKIFILPNSIDAILIAQQVVQTTKKDIFIIPTKTQMEGIVAMFNFNPEEDFNDVKEAMEDSLNDVKTGEVKKALETKKIGKIQVKKNEYLAIIENKIITSMTSKIDAAIEICKNLINDDTEIVTIYYGESSSEIDAQEIRSFIEMRYDVEMEIKFGGQPTNDFLIAFE